MYIDLIILRISYALVLLGIIIIFSDEIHYYIKKASTLRKKLPGTEKPMIIHHLEKIMNIVYQGQNAKRNVTIFIAISLSIYILFLYFLLYQGFGIRSVLVSAALALMPYGYLRSKLATTRIAGSYEGEKLIAELVNQYKMNSRNIIAALDDCVLNLEDEPISKRALFRLSMRVKTYQAEEELRAILDDFIYAFHTEWSKMLADNFYSAIEEKIDVLTGLEGILSECKQINENLEKGKRNNIEAFVMIKYLGPFFFVVFLWMAHSMMDYSWQEIFEYEFQRSDGLMIFIMSIGAIFINLVAVNLLSRQKYDI